MSGIIYVPHRDAVQLRLGQIRVFGNVWHRDARYKICTAQEMPYIFINRNQYGTGMPDFWPIQLETGALPNVPFPPITLVFICLPTSRKLLK